MKKIIPKKMLTKTNTKKIKILPYAILCMIFVIIHILSYYFATNTTIQILHNNPHKEKMYNNEKNEKILNLGIKIVNSSDFENPLLVIIEKKIFTYN
ncbi:hypothetical protein [Candidatus Phytoplasma meliae]|uniref:Uncharacterized protein n=1 Tax=Candidatus Phytoplasma meliae TaxID=1848402 RepID=A0ABS5CZ02_9MOLU|nr:hypothetical protein [Candidatus Phytoplasma meliae]MBP5835768.1 hypothetical protein [Candidatus Phytoplasma meliae]MBP5836221.1 hypothetical protein [Candidatus Phytoplasma meliae]